MKQEITVVNYICDCCHSSFPDEDFIKFHGHFPFKEYGHDEYGSRNFRGYTTKEVDLCEGCCEKLIKDICTYKFCDPETYLDFVERADEFLK